MDFLNRNSLQISAMRGLSCLVCLTLLIVGCSRSDEDYFVITEDMLQYSEELPAEESSTAEIDGQSPMATGTPSTTSMTDGANSANNQSSADASETEDSNEGPDGTATSAAESGDSKPTTNTDSTLKVENFINLEEEKARQERLRKLGMEQGNTDSEPREPKLLVPERDFSKESESNAWRVTYDDLDLLKILNMQPVPLNAVDYLPDWLIQLEGERIILRGWMFPPDRSEGIKGFIFVRDNQVCCFGPNAKAYDKLTVRLKEGQTTKYIQGRPFDVIGTFHIDAWIEDERDMKTGEFIEKIGMLYHLEDAEIVDKS